MFEFLTRLFKFKPPRRSGRSTHLRARYDAAATTGENYRHWAQTDPMSARMANRLEIRKRLRERSRYEFDNNGYCHGLILTLANDAIGTGPILQVHTPDTQVNQQIEAVFHAWTDACALAEKLHTLKQSKTRDGEGFAVFVTNPQIDHAVQLDLKLLECDQVTTPTMAYGLLQPGWVDGIEFDTYGNPIWYHILKTHPGDWLSQGGAYWEYDRTPARNVLHWFRSDRPGQARGIPEITPALPLFAQLRRYTLATLQTAEIGAEFSALLESDSPADSDADEPMPFASLEIDRGMMTTLPAGAHLKQLEPTQPTGQYQEFKRELLKEIGRPLNAPFNVISGDSSPYNYSSARLDHILYRGAIRVERDHLRRTILKRILAAWLDEAVMIPGLLPALPAGVSYAELPATWFWPGFESIDPTKDAAADTERLANGTTTLQEVLAEYGQDWQAFTEQRAREVKMQRANGLTPVLFKGTDPMQPGPAPVPGMKEQAAAAAAAILDLAAGYDPDQPRDDSGKWSESSGDPAVDRQRRKEDRQLERQRDREDSHRERKREREDTHVDRQREKESRNHPSAVLERQHEREDEALYRRHEREKETHGESDALSERHNQEEQAHNDRQKAEMDKVLSDPEIARQDREREERHNQEDKTTEVRRQEEDKAIDNRRDQEDQAIDDRRRQENEAIKRRTEGSARLDLATAYDPDQPRDDKGQWSESAAGKEMSERHGDENAAHYEDWQGIEKELTDRHADERKELDDLHEQEMSGRKEERRELVRQVRETEGPEGKERREIVSKEKKAIKEADAQHEKDRKKISKRYTKEHSELSQQTDKEIEARQKRYEEEDRAGPPTEARQKERSAEIQQSNKEYDARLKDISSREEAEQATLAQQHAEHVHQLGEARRQHDAKSGPRIASSERQALRQHDKETEAIQEEHTRANVGLDVRHVKEMQEHNMRERTAWRVLQDRHKAEIASSQKGVQGTGQTVLQAEADPNRLIFSSSEGFALEAAGSIGNGLKKFTATAYTGVPMQLAEWSAPIVADLEGMSIPAHAIPVLMQHDASRIVAHTQNIEKTPQRLKVAGLISGIGPAAQEVVSLAANGFPWQISIGAEIKRREIVEPGKSVTVNGRSWTGPLIIARETVLREISFVPLGGDHATSAAIAAHAGTQKEEFAMSFTEWVQGIGLDPAKVLPEQKTLLEAAYSAAYPPPPKPEEPQKPEPKPGTPQPVPGIGATGVQGPIGPSGLFATSQLADYRRLQAEETERVAFIRGLCARHGNPTMTIGEGQSARLVSIEAHAIGEGWDRNKTELEVIRATRAPGSMNGIACGNGRHVAGDQVLAAAICQTAHLGDAEKTFEPVALDAARRQFPKGIGLQQVLLHAAWNNGFVGDSVRSDPTGVLKAAFSTASIAGILSNIANKFLLQGFMNVEKTWQRIAATRTVSDFKTVTSYRLTGGFMFEIIGPTGELKHDVVGQESYTNQAQTYGKMFAITRQDIINDDLGALTDVPRRIGRGAALKLNDVFWSVFLNNATFFASGNKNYITGATSNLSSTSLQTALQMFRDQVDGDGTPLAIEPKILLVPNPLEVTALQLNQATTIAAVSASPAVVPNVNIWAGRFMPAVSAYLTNTAYTGNSATAWYLLAEPQDLAVIEVAFLNGIEVPTVETAEVDFNQLGIQMRGYFDFGVALQDPRAGVKTRGT